MGGLIELRGDTLNLQGNVFKACGQEEAVALLEGRADYDGDNKNDITGDNKDDNDTKDSNIEVTDNLLQ